MQDGAVRQQPQKQGGGEPDDGDGHEESDWRARRQRTGSTQEATDAADGQHQHEGRDLAWAATKRAHTALSAGRCPHRMDSSDHFHRVERLRQAALAGADAASARS